MDASPIRIRQGRASDAAAIASLCSELGYPSSEEQAAARLGRLAAQHHGLFVAEDAGGEVTGLLDVHERVLLEEDPFAEITAFIVTEQARGRGVGTLLVAAAAEWTRDRGLVKLWVRVREHREATHRFYENLGFRLEKRQRVYSYPL